MKLHKISKKAIQSKTFGMHKLSIAIKPMEFGCTMGNAISEFILPITYLTSISLLQKAYK